jgi:uncharacterized phage infection (PIP) family protein YhgE
VPTQSGRAALNNVVQNFDLLRRQLPTLKQAFSKLADNVSQVMLVFAMLFHKEYLKGCED